MTQTVLKSQRPYSPGLEGIVAGISQISEIDPKTEHLTYRGYDIHDLVEHSTYEETAYLLLMGSLPNRGDLKQFEGELVSQREIPSELLDTFRILARRRPSPMDVLKASVSVLGMCDPDAADHTHQVNIRKAVRLIAQVPTLIASSYRIMHGEDAVKPEPGFSHAKNFLYMLSGREPDAYSVHVFDRCLILYAEHGFNASTFSARVTASTLSDLHSAVTSAAATLKGPLHGGANEEAMKMLLEIDAPERARAWINEALANKKRIMGFGHREYKLGDPRAKILKPLMRELGKRLGQTKWAQISEILEETIIKSKGLHPNVDFPSGVVFYLLGLPIETFTPIFAMARIAGWTAQIIEQLDNNRLIRPECEYDGERDRKYLPIDKR